MRSLLFGLRKNSPPTYCWRAADFEARESGLATPTITNGRPLTEIALPRTSRRGPYSLLQKLSLTL